MTSVKHIGKWLAGGGGAQAPTGESGVGGNPSPTPPLQTTRQHRIDQTHLAEAALADWALHLQLVELHLPLPHIHARQSGGGGCTGRAVRHLHGKACAVIGRDRWVVEEEAGSWHTRGCTVRQ